MPGHEPDLAFLWDMLDAAQSIEAFVRGMSFDEFQADRRTYRAVERELEILGEAAKGVSAWRRGQPAEVPWTRIIGQRNLLAHQYGQIRYDVVWQTVTRDIPPLVQRLGQLVPSPQDVQDSPPP
jgi:uncharacterized protein with HEPN domain